MEKIKALDEVVEGLCYASSVFFIGTIPFLEEMNGYGIEGEECAKRNFEKHKTDPRIHLLENIKIEDIENEIFEKCQDINNLPEFIAIVETNFRQIKLPDGYKGFFEWNHKDLSRLGGLNNISKDFRNEIAKYLSHLSALCSDTVEGIIFLVEKLRKYYQNYNKVIAGALHEYGTDKIKKQIVRESSCIGTFRDKIITDNKDEVLSKLHALIDGKRGKFVSLVILVSVDMGLIQKPTYNDVKEEFGDIGAGSNYRKYLNKERYSSTEYDGMKKSIFQLI